MTSRVLALYFYLFIYLFIFFFFGGGGGGVGRIQFNVPFKFISAHMRRPIRRWGENG